MTPRQFAEWLEYERLEPFGDRRADYRAALIAMMLANINRDTKRRPTPWKLEDFLLANGEGAEAPRGKRKQTWQEQLAIAKAIATAFNRKDRAMGTRG